jgi:ferritin-like metal-binding protein YciE
MADDLNARDSKLIQYLNEAYGKEKELETALQAHIKMATGRKTYKKRLQDHLKETKAQARNLERRIKQLGGRAEAFDLPGPDRLTDAAGAAASLANKAMAAAKGPIQAVRGTSPADNQLRNLRDCYWNEAEEIAHYNVIEAFAEELKDKETAKLAREHRRQEERVQRFIEKQLPQLVKEVIRSEVPKDQRTPSTNGRSSSRSTSRTSSSRSRSASSSRSKSSSSRSKSSSSRSKSSSGGSRSRARSASGSSSGGGSRSS